MTALDLLDRPAWMADALCREPDHRPAFQAAIVSEGKGQVARCREVCARCLVREECAAHVLVLTRRRATRNDPELRGVWAGRLAREWARLAYGPGRA